MADNDQQQKQAPDVLKPVKWIGRSARAALTRELNVPHLTLPRLTKLKPGSRPGLDQHELETRLAETRDEPWSVEVIDYSPDRIEVTQITDVSAFLENHREVWVKCRWINVTGLHNPDVMRVLTQKYSLHPLAMEDVLNIPQRPKVEDYVGEARYAARLFIVLQMVRMNEDNTVDTEQVSLFLGPDTIISLQEREGDVWQPVRDRMHSDESRIRKNDISFLLYSLLDSVVDHYYPVLEHFGDRLEQIEATVLEDPDEAVFHKLHAIKRELMLIRRHLWPTRELLSQMIGQEDGYLSDAARTYLRDVQDHATQAIELIDTYREVATNLADAFISAVSHRMNEVMKFLTILATIFIPITFIAGVWGMNFESMPELDEPYGYAMAWTVFITIALIMAAWFRHKRWL